MNGVFALRQLNNSRTISGNLPDFMKEFLERMKLAAESHRQGNSGDLRTVCDNLRSKILLNFGEVLFNEFLERTI